MIKQRPIRIKKIRESARGMDCTVESPYCNHNTETTVFAHYGEPGEKGMGMKPDDTSGFYSCSACHDFVDGRSSWGSSIGMASDVEWYCFRAMRRTFALLIRNGVLG